MLDILATFLVDEVEVEDTLANGQKFIPQPVQEKKWQTGEKDKTFVDFYLEAVQQYQKHFQQWQAGYTVNVTEIRKLLLPLCGKIVEKPQFIFTLHKLNKKEEYIYHHAVSVSLIAAFLAKKLAYSIEDWIEVALAGAFVDIGMSQLPTKILTKSGKLTAGEFKKVKRHPIFSYHMLKGLKSVSDAMLLSVIQHHERADGSGYPFRTAAKKIHPYSRIIAVADVYHAMISERLYRPKRSPYQALEAISKEHFGKFEHNVVQTLMNVLLNVTTGTSVKLTNGKKAEIVFVDQNSPTRPMVKIKETGEIINLVGQREIEIEEIFD